MCKVLQINRSGYYAWLKHPLSERKIEDDRVHELIKHYWEETDKVYGSPRIFADLREAGETCGVNRVARIMEENGIKAVCTAVLIGTSSAGITILRFA